LSTKTSDSNTMQAFWVAMGSLSSFSLAILSAAILSRYFDKTEYGTYKQIIYVYNSLLVVFTAGLPKVFGYFLPRYDLDQGKEIVNRITLYLLGLGVLFGLFLFFGAGIISNVLNNPEMKEGLKIFSPVPALLLPTLGLEGIFSSYRKTQYIAVYNTLSRFMMLICIVTPVVYFGADLKLALYGWLVASFLSFLLALYMKSLPFKNLKTRISALPNKEIFKYSLPLVSASIAGILISAADQFYISRYFGAEVFAEYSNGFQQIPFIPMITGAVGTVLMPVFSKHQHNNVDKNEILDLWQRSISKSAILIYPIVIFFIFFAESVVVVLFSELYLPAANYFRLSMLVNFFNIGLFAPFLLAWGYHKIYSNVHLIFAAVIWIGGFIVIKIIPNPLLIASLSVFLSILKIICFFLIIKTLLNTKLKKLIPTRLIISLILNSIICCILSGIIISICCVPNTLMYLSTAFIIYLTLIVLTGRFVSINYLEIGKPIIKKLLKLK
jgi:O-antigen/teichoic acid export membrane protein